MEHDTIEAEAAVAVVYRPTETLTHICFWKHSL